MPDFVFEPPLRLAHDVTLRTLDDAAEFARTYVSRRLPQGPIALCPVSKRYPTRPARVALRERFARGSADASGRWPNNRKQFSHICRQHEPEAPSTKNCGMIMK